MPTSYLGSLGHITPAHVAIRMRLRGVSIRAIALGMKVPEAEVRDWIALGDHRDLLDEDAPRPADVALGRELLGVAPAAWTGGAGDAGRATPDNGTFRE